MGRVSLTTHAITIFCVDICENVQNRVSFLPKSDNETMSWKYWDEKSQNWRLVADNELDAYNATLGNIGVSISRREERTEKCNLVLPKLTVSTIENRQLKTPASYYRPKITRPRRRRQPRREVNASTDKSGIFLEPHLTTHKRLVWCPNQAAKVPAAFQRREPPVGPIAIRKTLQEFKAAGLISPVPSGSVYEKLHKSSIRLSITCG